MSACQIPKDKRRQIESLKAQTWTVRDDFKASLLLPKGERGLQKVDAASPQHSPSRLDYPGLGFGIGLLHPSSNVVAIKKFDE